MASALRKEESKVFNMIRKETNFLPSMFFKKLSEHLNGDNFQWFFSENSMDNTKAPYIKDDDFLFTHNLFTAECGKASNFFEMFEPILYSINEKVKVNKLIRMKLNLYTNQGKKITYCEHCDTLDKDNNIVKDNHTALLNFTTCNGGTNINKKVYNSNANELLIFNNATKHSGISQTDTKTRIVLNINWR
jgi:hypothetical protein